MNAVLAEIIPRFRAAQDRGVATLVELLELPMPTSQWHWFEVCAEFGLGSIHSVNGIGVIVHGYGIWLRFPDLEIDWDWGDRGEPDGFDSYRLWNFVRGNRLPFDCGATEFVVRAWLEEAYQHGELTRDDHLYYAPAYRAPGWGDRDGDLA